jgi:putative peptidoglycan lipid II flippase
VIVGQTLGGGLDLIEAMELTDVELSPSDRPRPEKRREILRVSLLLIGITLASKILAYVVQMKKASYFGIGPVVDCYEWAIFFPALIYSFSFNVLNTMLVPVFSGRAAGPSLDRAYHAVVTWCLTAFLALGLVFFLFAPSCVTWFSGFEDPRRHTLAALFLSILACATLFIGIEGVQSGFLLAEKRAIAVSLVRLIKEIVFVAIVVTSFRWLGDQLLPTGWLISAAVGGAVFLALGIRRHRFAFRLIHVDDDIRRLFRNVWPVLTLYVLINVNDLVRIRLLSVQSGDLSTYRYAYYIFLLPHVLMAENLVLFLFPLMAAEVNQGDLGRLRHSIRSGIKLSLFFILPASVGIITLARPIIQILYERHHFSSADTSATLWPLIYLSLGMWAFGLHILFARVLDALQAYWRRVAIELPYVALSVVLSFWWIRRFGHNGAAWSFVVALVFLLALEVGQIRRRIGNIQMRLVVSDLVKIAAATAAMALTARLIHFWSGQWLGAATTTAHLIRLGGAIMAGLVVYLGGALALRVIRASDLAELRDYFLFRRAGAAIGKAEQSSETGE